ncbi:MAG: hypothetical protein E7169_01845 [Firmicutes bacterium]|nr:hypothetical protein [Bacillota bacterium]
MERLNEILHELGISKVKLAKFLGVSRQMIYNYLELDDINKWPKDKKVMLLNLLGVKSAEEVNNIKVDTDYILDVETRLNNIVQVSNKTSLNSSNLFNDLGKKQKELFLDIMNLVKEHLEDEKNDNMYYTYKYLHHFLQTIETSKELKYILAYISKAAGFVDPMEFKFNEDEQFIFESIMFSGMTLYNSGGASKTRIAESHRRFVNQIEHKLEEKLSRTLELNTIKAQALKELGYTTITDENAAEVFQKIAEIESRKVTN